MKKWQIQFIMLFLLSELASAQINIGKNREVIEDVTENSADELNESGQNEIPVELFELFNYPLNPNNDNLEIFVRFNLVTQSQLTALEKYLTKMGKLIELEELQQIEGFDKKTIETIIPYCQLITSNKVPCSDQLTLRFQKNQAKSEENYAGSNSKILVRYKTVLTSSLNISFTAEKDAGEEIFTRQKKGFDFNSLNIFYKGKSALKKIIAGDYSIEYGQGLTAWTGLSFGSGYNITGIYKFGRGIMPYSGTDENRFFRGIAVSTEKNKIRFDSWVSYHSIDGNKILDTTNNEEYISSLQTSGYHRTPSEIQDRHSQQETAFGSAINYSSENLNTGIVVSGQHYQTPILKGSQPHTQYEFNGRDNLNIGWNYSYSFKNIFFFGETAYNINNSYASLNGMLLIIDPRFSIGILWRSYSQKFTSLKSNAFGVNTKNTNEHGNYIGILYKLTRILTYSGYTDIFSFPSIKYRVDKPSYGFDFFQQLEYTPTKKFNAKFRYRNKLKQLNDVIQNTGLNNLSDLSLNSIRLSARFKIDNSWEYSLRFELSTENKTNKRIGRGTLVSQDIFFHPMGKPYSANCRYAVFNCPEFDTRIYEYENDVQGAFSIPFYFGIGSHFYTNLNYKISSNITIALRYAISWIDNELASNKKSEIKLQLKTNFR